MVAAAGPTEICLADTIGVAVPADVRERVRAVQDAAGDVSLRCHFHDTRYEDFLATRNFKDAT